MFIIQEQNVFEKIDNLDIVQVVQATGLEITRRGNKYEALCPFHGDKNTPSFKIYPSTNSWSCFGGCQHKKGKRNGGGVFSFLKQTFGSNKAAIDWAKTNYPDLKTLEVEKIELKPVTQNKILLSSIEYWSKFLWIDQKESFFLNRGFEDWFIKEQGFGWDGDNYIIPIWEGKPFNSPCYSVKKRTTDPTRPKYIKDGEFNKSLLWGKYYNQYDIVFLFAGELDAALAVQNGLPAMSVVDGMGAGLPDNWIDFFFKNQKKIVFVFDKKEARVASVLADAWQYIKGYGNAIVFSWPPFDGDDYNDYVLKHSHELFMKLIRIRVPDIDRLLEGDY